METAIRLHCTRLINDISAQRLRPLRFALQKDSMAWYSCWAMSEERWAITRHVF